MNFVCQMLLSCAVFTIVPVIKAQGKDDFYFEERQHVTKGQRPSVQLLEEK